VRAWDAVAIALPLSAMRYRLMNDYLADWPFWGDGEDAGLCAAGNPALPADLEADIRAWAACFNDQFSREYGWPEEETAAAHKVEGERLHRCVQRALPEHDIVLNYWEKSVR